MNPYSHAGIMEQLNNAIVVNGRIASIFILKLLFDPNFAIYTIRQYSKTHYFSIPAFQHSN
jgi:hypothetical protein